MSILYKIFLLFLTNSENKLCCFELFKIIFNLCLWWRFSCKCINYI